MRAEYSTSMRDNVGVVHCHGEIVFGVESDELRRVVLEMLRHTSQIVLDLGHVTYVDSSGMGALVNLYISARNRNGEIKLGGALSPKVRNVFDTMKLTQVFDVHGSEDQAIKAFRTRGRDDQRLMPGPLAGKT